MYIYLYQGCTDGARGAGTISIYMHMCAYIISACVYACICMYMIIYFHKRTYIYIYVFVYTLRYRYGLRT